MNENEKMITVDFLELDDAVSKLRSYIALLWCVEEAAENVVDNDTLVRGMIRLCQDLSTVYETIYRECFGLPVPDPGEEAEA